MQHDAGHSGLYCCIFGFVISEKHPFLGASPDGVVDYPSVPNHFGLAEIKCSFSFRDKTTLQAAESPNFCSKLVVNADRT